MDWVEGDTLGVFLEDNHKDKARLERLRIQFGEVERFLRSKGMAHGDLQNGNVLVKSDLKLIDYDGVYVPALQTGAGAELGHKHFQHPKRAASDFGPHMDRFSFAVIDLSLRALVAQPALFDRYSNGENIILTANDFLDPSNSRAFSGLKAIPALTKFATDLANISAAPMAAIPSLEDYLAGRNIPAATIVIRSPSQAAAAPKPTASYVGAFDVVDASNYDAVSGQIGNRIELVGQVVKVHLGKTKRGGRPYAFVFFNNTRRGVRINIWNDGLDKLTDQPGQGWVGRWLSVQGLVDPPYTSKYGISLSITITSSSQLRTIHETEARRRLRAPSPGLSTGIQSPAAPSSNADILRELQNMGLRNNGTFARTGRPTATLAPPLAPPVSSNQAILNSILPKAPSAGTGQAQPAPQRHRPGIPVGSAPSRQSSGGTNWRAVGIIILVLYIAFMAAQGG